MDAHLSMLVCEEAEDGKVTCIPVQDPRPMTGREIVLFFRELGIRVGTGRVVLESGP